MATEQPEVETTSAPAVAANSQADITQQATTPTPTQSVKNPKRVAIGQPFFELRPASRVAANSQDDITQQATTPTPTQRVKNPKRVAAGKMVAERTRIAREQQKKAMAEASIIIANNNAKATAAAPETHTTTEVVESPRGLSVNQWIGIGGLAVSLAGIYYKREELKAAFSKKKNRLSPRPPVFIPRHREKV